MARRRYLYIDSKILIRVNEDFVNYFDLDFGSMSFFGDTYLGIPAPLAELQKTIENQINQIDVQNVEKWVLKAINTYKKKVKPVCETMRKDATVEYIEYF